MQLLHGSVSRGGRRGLVLGALALATVASAETIHVPGDYPTIQLAIDACGNGDEVVVADGTYVGFGNRNLDFGGRLITVRSASGDPGACVIDCQRGGRGFVFTSGETATAIVDGFTIANGVADYGGGIFVDDAGPTVRDCVIEDCFADLHGGAAYINGGLVSFTDCTFRRNRVFNDGGAIYAYEGGASPISGCVFEDNQAGDRGGALFNYVDWDVEISQTSFTGNSAGGSGGAIYHDADMITLDGCTFRGNDAGGDGGAVLVDSTWLDVIDSTFELNHATGDGGAIAAGPANLTVTGSDFTANTAQGTGGGVFCSGSLVTLTGCSFERNDAASDPSGGGAIHQIEGAMALITCEFDANTAVRFGGAFHNEGGLADFTACTFTGNSTAQHQLPEDEGGGAVANGATGSLTMRMCVFSENHTVGMGGAVLNGGTIADLQGCTFTGNTATRPGGAVSNGEWEPRDVVIRGCRFEENASEFGGGAIAEGFGLITDCVFVGNIAETYGGAVFGYRGYLELANSRFFGNQAGPEGGGVWANRDDWRIVNCEFGTNVAGRGGGVVVDGFSLIANCTFWGNSNYAVYAKADDEVYNSILWNNVPSAFDGFDPPVVSFCDVEGGWGGTGQRNIDIDPLLVNPDGPDGVPGTEDDDLRLRCTSPCIDAASNALVPADTADLDGDGDRMEPLPLDIDRNPRFVDHPLMPDTGEGDPPIVDMGAYEFQASACPADLNGNGAVEFGDVLVLLLAWGDCGGCPEDLDCDDVVAFSDVLILLAAWGPCA